jgi:hypothetical protein
MSLSASNIFTPFYRQALSRQNHAEFQRSAPARFISQASKNDAPGGDAGNFEEHHEAGSDAMPKQEPNPIHALENVLKKNPYLGMISQMEIKSLQKNAPTAELWAKTEKFLDDCEGQIQRFANIRAELDALVEGAIRTDMETASGTVFATPAEVQRKLRIVEAHILKSEIRGGTQMISTLSLRGEALTHRIRAQQDALLAGDDDEQRKALISCMEARNAAWKDVAASMKRTLALLEAYTPALAD